MVVDTSAILAVLFREKDADGFVAAMAGAAVRRMSSVAHVECAILLTVRHGQLARRELDELLRALSIRVDAFTEAQAQIAADAFERYGEGRHPAVLNSATAAATPWRRRRASRCY